MHRALDIGCYLPREQPCEEEHDPYQESIVDPGGAVSTDHALYLQLHFHCFSCIQTISDTS